MSVPCGGKQDVVLSDEVRVGLTSSFLPGVSLLFGALFSYTISLLVRKSNGALSHTRECLKAEEWGILRIRPLCTTVSIFCPVIVENHIKSILNV